jgi:acrylyl-CoA reductase (NADPH)
MNVPAAFTAVVAETAPEGHRVVVREVERDDFLTGAHDVTVRVEYSGINYKDALAMSPNGKVARLDPLIPGVDLAGVVVDPGTSGLETGTAVLATGYDLGVSSHGGFAQYAQLASPWCLPIPQGLTARDVMAVGTAGFTAALSVDALESRGLAPGDGPVIVTGASGGVGSNAVAMLAARGYEVVAATGKRDQTERLIALGASTVVDRVARSISAKPLSGARWAGAIDSAGGEGLVQVISELRYGAAVAASGMTGGTELPASVLPFILRGVALLGIDSVQCSADQRRRIWDRIAGDLRPGSIDLLLHETVELTAVPGSAARLLRDASRGRTLVHV